jgi:hypothetical protein
MKTPSKILILLVIIIASSCGSKKKLVEKTSPTITCGIATDSLRNYFPILDSVNHDWLKIKGDLTAEYIGKSYNINIQLRIKPNETVWISLSKASFPILKMLMTQDSIQVMDMFNNKYLKTDYKGLSQRIGVEINFDLLQNILLAQYLPLPNNNHIWEESNRAVVSSHEKSKLNAAFERPDSTIHFMWAQWISCTTQSVAQQYILVPSTKEELWIRSENPDTTTYLNIPTKIEVTALKDKNKKVFIALNYKRFNQAQYLKVPFKIPDSYVEME